jgi:hypothetical protein
MSSWQVTSSTKIRKSPRLIFAMSLVGFALTSSSPVMAQKGGAPSAVIPEIAIRQPNRQMDDYDRELDRFKAAAMLAAGRRRSLLARIKEDFERIQAIHNEMLVMIEVEERLKYDRLVELSSEMKKRTRRLWTNLALPAAADGKEDSRGGKRIKAPANGNHAGVRESFLTLHDVLVSFVTNPIFKNLRLFDANEVNRASGDLKDIILLTDIIKKSAKTLSQDRH